MRSFLDDHGAIVQWSAGAEDRSQQIVGKAGVEGNSAFDMGAQSDFTFDHDQRSGLVLGKKIRGQHDVVVGIALPRRPAQKSQSPAQVGEHMPDLGLENNDERKHQVGQDVAHNPVERCEFADAGQVEQHGDDHQAHEHGSGARAADDDQHLVDDQGNEENVERDPRGLRP